MYKNQLQEFAQKNGIPLPIYQTVNEGFDHATMFRSTVLFEGSRYESTSTHPTKKQAEQEAAKQAYECVCKKIYATDIIDREPKLCKTILHDFAGKKHWNKPTYDTKNAEGPGLVFISKTALGGKTYGGEVAGSKNMAEQVAARAAIASLLETDDGTLCQIIMSKEKCHPGIQTTMDTTTSNAKILPECSGPRQKARIEQAVVCFNPGGAAGNPGCFNPGGAAGNPGGAPNPGTGPKRKTVTNNWARNNRRRF